MYIEVNGTFKNGDESRGGRFYINSEHIVILEKNGENSNLHLPSGAIVFSDAKFSDIQRLLRAEDLRKTESEKAFASMFGRS